MYRQKVDARRWSIFPKMVTFGKSTVKHSLLLFYSSYTEGKLSVNAAVNYKTVTFCLLLFYYFST